MVKDALGNKIIIGAKYGYASSVNGIPTVVIGVANVCKNELKVTLKSVQKRSGIYGEIKGGFESQAKSVTPYACSLFPISEDENDSKWQQIIDYFEDKYNIIFCRNVNYTFKNNQPVLIEHNYKLVKIGMVGEPIFTKECATRLEARQLAIEHAFSLIPLK
jgi:hypothetical protein